MATGLARSLLQRTLGRPSLRPLASRLASGEAYVPEKPPVEGKTENLKLVHAINNALDIAMESDSTAAIFGEDVGFGGVFRCSANLRDKLKLARKLCLSMCHQIVKGMAHIAEKLFVHCDLAARNCLIGGDGVVKVSDFGLAAKLNPGHNQYLRPPGASARVPIKWMAPESIEHRGLFSEKTDVWSFGVTCWEVFTCGAMPYDGVPPAAVMREVLDGNRLERPSNLVCSDRIWSVITDCWQEDHEKRPNFVSLVDSLFNLMDSDPTYIMLH